MTQPETVDLFNSLTESYRNRANALRQSGKQKFNLIIVALFLAIAIFVFAGFLTAKNSEESASNLLKLETEADTLLSRHKSNLDSLDNLVNKSYLTYRLYRSDSITEQIENIIAQVAREDFRKYGNGKLVLLNQMIEKLKELKETKIDEQKSNNYINFFTTLSTRIGAILILIFLVQLLIRVYRYDMRMANYYDARADALEIHTKDKELAFDKIINLLSPDMYDIGSPRSPSESILSMFRAIREVK